jgi:hypothetical protein
MTIRNYLIRKELIRNLNYFCYVLIRNKGENDEK